MNKAFVRDPSKPPIIVLVAARKASRWEARRWDVPDGGAAGRLAEPANFCPSPQCPVAYFDGFERLVLAVDSAVGLPQGPDAPICACSA